jgi:thiol-disulfide isomerase/thioredoxin
MKQTFYLFLCFFSLSIFAQEDAITAIAKGETTGIAFVDKPFEALLAQAKAENKVIFIDAFTTWCGPCKVMSAKVFPRPEVGAVYNERFINAKIDMEKGEGPALATRYNVNAYPTYLFVDGNGDIVHKGLGQIPVPEFLKLAEAAFGDNNLGALNKRYDAGERSAEFMQTYAGILTDVNEAEKAATVADEYLASLDNWNDPAVLSLLIANPGELGGKRMKYLLDNSETAMESVGESNFMMVVQQAFFSTTAKRVETRSFPEIEDMTETYNAFAGDFKDRLTKHYTMIKAERMGDTDAYLPAAIAYFSAYGSDNATELNSAAWSVFESSEDPAQLKEALKWAKQSVAIEAQYPNMDTLAWLYQKTGDKKMAKETALKAIELAKESDQDYEDTAKILEME